MHFDDYLSKKYVDDKLIENIPITQLSDGLLEFSMEVKFNDKITFEVKNGYNICGIAGKIDILGNIFTTTDYSSRWISTLPSAYDKNLMIKQMKGGFYYLGNVAQGLFNFSFIIPEFYSISDNEITINCTPTTIDLTKYYKLVFQETKDNTFFEITTLPTRGSLQFLDGNQVRLNTNYSEQQVIFEPENGGAYKDAFIFAVGNSTRILSNPGTLTIYVCWKGCNGCDKDALCLNSDCTTIGKQNCKSCSQGYSGFISPTDSRRECWDNTIIHDFYYLDKVDDLYKSCHERCQNCDQPESVSGQGCTKCKNPYHLVYKETNCKELSEMPGNYYLDNNDDMLHECSSNCTECTKGPVGNNNYCTGCLDGYLEKNGNCLPCHERCDKCSELPSDIGHGCTKCKAGYHLVSQETNCGDDTYKNNGYYLDNDMFYKCSSNCTTCSKGKVGDTHYCTACQENYIIENQNCLPCYERCKGCTKVGDAQDHSCASCKDGFKFVYLTSNCEEDSILDKGYFLHPDGKYHECSSNCTKCSQEAIGDNNNCDTCKEGFALSQGNCLPCYETCESCLDIGTEDNHQCTKCKENYYEVFQENNCGDNTYLDKGYYLDNNIFYKCSSNCTTCTNGAAGDNNHCKTCPEGFYLSDENCLPKRSDGNFKVIETDKSIKDFINENVTDLVDEKLIYKGENFSAQIYKTTKDDEIAKNHGENHLLSSVDMSECIKILRKNLGLKPDEDIIIMKIDRNVTDSVVNAVDILLFMPDGTPIDYSICKDTEISVDKPLTNTDLLNMTKLKDLAKEGIDAFNTKDKFFNDICYPYTTEHSTDVVLSDRRKDYFQNVSLCEDNCEYESFDEDTNIVHCNCDPVLPEEKKKEIIDSKVSMSAVKNAFLDNLFSSNIIVVKCFKLAFSKEVLFNIGFWVLGGMTVIEIVCLILHIIRGLEKLTDYMLIFISGPPVRSSIKEKEWDFFNYDENEEKTSPIRNKNSHYETSSRTTRMNFVNPRSRKQSQSKLLVIQDNKSNENNKRCLSNFSEKEIILSQTQANTEFESQTRSRDSNSDKGLKHIWSKFRNSSSTFKKHKYKSKERLKLPIQYDEMSYEEAIESDHRSFCQIYWTILKEKHIIISTFIDNSFIDLRVIKIYIFFFSTSLDFTLNALFFTDDDISQLYYTNGVLDVISSLPRSFFSSIIGALIGYVVSKLSDTKSSLEVLLKPEILKEKNVYLSKLHKAIKCFRIKLTFFFIISFLLSLFFWYYVTCFCAVYYNSQIHWLVSSLQSTLISVLVPFITSFILALLRYESLSLKSKCLFRLYKITDFIL